MRSVYSKPNTNDGHLRPFLDQRTTHASPSDRYSSLSQFSDTPSVYSRAHLSSGINDRDDAQSFSGDYHHISAHSTRERFQDPHVSSLDFSDDRSSPASTSETYDGNPHSFEDHCERDEDPADRMSYLGPKMRFHSRAPWEMEAGALEEEDESTESPKPSVFPFSFGGSKGSPSASSSPRPSHSTSRPSEDSFRSNVQSKRSFETINSQMSSRGTLYALAQESLSATSLGRPAPRDGLLQSSPLGRAKTPTNQTIPTPSSPVAQFPRVQPLGLQPPPMNRHDTHLTHETYDTQRPGFASPRYTANESFHPYANPDVLPSKPAAVPHVPPMNAQFPRGPSGPPDTRSRLFEPPPHAPSLSGASKQRTSSIHGKGISSPIAVQGSALPPSISNDNGNLGSNLPGWTERIVPPSFSLISLEEARAQQGKSNTVSDDLTRTFSSNTSISAVAQGQDELSASASSAASIRSRGRTISAGAKAKSALQSMVGSVKPDRRESEPAIFASNTSHPGGKMLKHRKSGFMRLFNKDKEKEEEAPPPVPLLAPTLSPDSDPTWKKSSVSRVPLPSLTSVDYSKQTRSSSLGPKQAPPNLQINTQTNGPGVVDPALATATSPLRASKPWVTSHQPQSAPADVSTFPALRLRPVSTLFSARDFEHFVPELQSNANDHSQDTETPTSLSPNDLISPITPGGMDTNSKSEFGNPSAVIQSLRDELTSTKATSERRIGNLEGLIRKLKLEVEELRSNPAYCVNCSQPVYSSPSPPSGPSSPDGGMTPPRNSNSLVNRPRAKTGTGARFVNASS